MTTPSVKVMTQIYLAKHGFDGLVNCHGECGCTLDDLFPCGGEGVEDCEAAHKVTFNGECPCGEHCDWHMVAGKKP